MPPAQLLRFQAALQRASGERNNNPQGRVSSAPSRPWSQKSFRTAALAAGGVVAGMSLSSTVLDSGIFNGNGFFGGSSGGRGPGGGPGGGSGWGNWDFVAGAAKADENDEGDDVEKFFCEGIKATNLPQGPGIPSQAELFEGLKCRKGVYVSRRDLSDDLNTLLSTGLFQNVDANVTPYRKGFIVEFVFTEKVWPKMESFKVTGATILPTSIADDVLREAQKDGVTTMRTLAAAKNIVENFYQERGITFGTVSHFDGMDSGNVIAHVIEGQITRVNLVFTDDQGREVAKPSTKPKVVYRELPIRQGMLYNVEDAKRALRDIFTLQLFDNVQVVPKPDEKQPSKVAVDVVLKERPVKAAEVEMEWGIAPGSGGKPDLVSYTPGGSVYLEHRNLDGEGRSVSASLSTGNFLAPQDDLGFKLEYARPMARGEKDPEKALLKCSAFNSRKVSPAFAGGPTMDEVPGVWIDRSGAKASLTENFTRQSKCTTGLVIQEITARDESGGLCTNGSKQLPTGEVSSDGPPTTWSTTGTDRVVSGQANITRDNTTFVNGTIVGARDILQAEQSLGFERKGSPLSNRHSLSLTRFIQLARPPSKSAMPPPVLALHGKYSGAVGDLPNYECFTLGGPHSCRAYNVGELGVARRALEYGGELRVPVPKLNCQAFAFYECATDLGSSKEVSGNPTEYYRRAGAGTSWGGGVKVGPVRAEWCQDGNLCKGAWFLRFGERY